MVKTHLVRLPRAFASSSCRAPKLLTKVASRRAPTRGRTVTLEVTVHIFQKIGPLMTPLTAMYSRSHEELDLRREQVRPVVLGPVGFSRSTRESSYLISKFYPET